jgi:hypothetical protein
VGPTCWRQFLRPRAPPLSLSRGPSSPGTEPLPHVSLFYLSAPRTLPVRSALPTPAVDRRVRTRTRRRISRPRRPPTRPAPLLEPRPCPHSLPRLISCNPTLARALLSPPDAVGESRPHSQPSSSPETVPSLPKLHPKVRHLCPCSISLVSFCASPILASPVLGRGGPPCSRGGRPI